MLHFFGVVGAVIILLALGAALHGADNPRGTEWTLTWGWRLFFGAWAAGAALWYLFWATALLGLGDDDLLNALSGLLLLGVLPALVVLVLGLLVRRAFLGLGGSDAPRLPAGRRDL